MSGPNEPYPEEGQMADLRAFLAGNHRRHPDWTAHQHLRAAAAHFGPEFAFAVEDHIDESFEFAVIDLLCEIA